MKSYFVATTTALAICCSSLAYAADSMNGTTLGEKGVSFSVTGSATLEVPNDSARITWTASTQEKTLEAATKKTIEITNSAIASLKKIPTLELQTVDVSSYPVYSEKKGNKAPEIVAWRVSQNLIAKTNDVSVVSKAIQTVGGKLQLNGLSFDVSVHTRAQYNEQLIKSALNNATQQAVWLAEAVGVDASHVQLEDVKFHGTLPVRPEYAVMRASNKAVGLANDAMPAPSIEAGLSTLNLSLSAQLKITK